MPAASEAQRGSLRLVYPRVRFRWVRYAHLAARSTAVRVTLCGRVTPGEPVPDGDYPELCPRCAARAR